MKHCSSRTNSVSKTCSSRIYLPCEFQLSNPMAARRRSRRSVASATEIFSPRFFRRPSIMWIYGSTVKKKTWRLPSLTSVVSESMNADYLLFRDMDERPCVTATKEAITNHRFSGLTWDRIMVVRQRDRSMVPSWTRRGSPSRTWHLTRVLECRCRSLKSGSIRLVGGEDEHTNAMDRNPQALRRRSRPPKKPVVRDTSGTNTFLT